MCTAFGNRQSFVSQSCRTSTSTGGRGASSRALSSCGEISSIARYSSARRRSLGDERAEPVVHGAGILDLGEVAAVVEPAKSDAPESGCGLSAEVGGNDTILAAVHEQDWDVERPD